MASLAEAQSFLRQRRATGRGTPQDTEAAFKAFFQSESDSSLARAGQDLQSRRTDISERQQDERIATEKSLAASDIAYKNSILTANKRAEDKAEEADRIKGIQQLAKIAIPDLFRDTGDTGGAQGRTQQKLGAVGSDQAVDSLDRSADGGEGINQGSLTGLASDSSTGTSATAESVDPSAVGQSLGKGFNASMQGLVNSGFNPTSAATTGLMSIANDVLGFVKSVLTNSINYSDEDVYVPQITMTTEAAAVGAAADAANADVGNAASVLGFGNPGVIGSGSGPDALGGGNVAGTGGHGGSAGTGTGPGAGTGPGTGSPGGFGGEGGF